MTIKNNLIAIYIMQAIDALAFSVSSIFVPIMLLESGFSFHNVICFFIVHHIVLLFGFFLAGFIASRQGFKKVLLFRYPFLFFYLLLLVVFKDLNINIYWLSVMGGLQASFYWAPLNILFARNAKKTEMGSAIGKLNAIPQIVGIFGPVIGGVLSLLFGFKVLFAMTFAISLVSFVPLLLAPSFKDNYNFEISKGFLFFKKNPKIFISEMIDNIGSEAEGIIWPIFVYLAVKNVVSVGVVRTLVAIGSALFVLALGKMTDKGKERKFFRIAVPLLILNWTVRYFFVSPAMIYITTLLSGFFVSLFIIPYTRFTYSQAKIDRNENFFIVKEVPTVIGRIIIYVLALLFVNQIQLLFPFIGLIYLFFYFL